jgi:hypothetical protein
MDLTHRAEHPFPDLMGCLPHRVVSRVLVTHLGDAVVLLGNLTQPASFPNGPRQRLLAINVLAHLHRRGGNHGVSVIGGRDRDGIELVPHRLEHLAIVDVLIFDLHQRGEAIEKLAVDVAEANHFTQAIGGFGVAPPLATDPDAGDLHFFVRRSRLLSQRAPRHPEPGTNRGRGLQELSTVCVSTH